MKTTDIVRQLTKNVALAAGLAGALGLAAPAVSFAQDRGPSAEQGERDHCRGRGHRRAGRGHPMRRMFQELDLSDAQREQIRGIMRDARGQRGEGRGEARRQVRERIQAVLTPAQRQRAQELRAEHARERIDRRVEHMTERLSLSERQQQQVRGILRHAAGQRRALMEQGQNDPASARDAMRGLHEQTTAQIRSVLNSEQQATFDEMRERRERRGHGRRGPGPRGAR